MPGLQAKRCTGFKQVIETTQAIADARKVANGRLLTPLPSSTPLMVAVGLSDADEAEHSSSYDHTGKQFSSSAAPNALAVTPALLDKSLWADMTTANNRSMKPLQLEALLHTIAAVAGAAGILRILMRI